MTVKTWWEWFLVHLPKRHTIKQDVWRAWKAGYAQGRQDERATRGTPPLHEQGTRPSQAAPPLSP